MEKVDDLELYFVGAGSKCLVWNYDIFGFDSGRTRQTADLFAEAGYLVIIPDFYRGTHREPTAPDVVQWIQEVTNWSKLKRTFEDIVMPFARNKGQEYAQTNLHLQMIFIIQVPESLEQLVLVGEAIWYLKNVPILRS